MGKRKDFIMEVLSSAENGCISVDLGEEEIKEELNKLFLEILSRLEREKPELLKKLFLSLGEETGNLKSGNPKMHLKRQIMTNRS